jgi:hypothetical protein
VDDDQTVLHYFVPHPGKRSVTGDAFDKFLEPLVQELRQLRMEGVLLKDAASRNSQLQLILFAIILWCIHDFLAYGMVASCVIKGYRACFICRPHMRLRQSQILWNYVWDSWVGGIYHPWRTNVSLFHGQIEDCSPPPPLISSANIWAWGKQWEEWLRHGRIPYSREDPVYMHG